MITNIRRDKMAGGSCDRNEKAAAKMVKTERTTGTNMKGVGVEWQMGDII